MGDTVGPARGAAGREVERHGLPPPGPLRPSRPTSGCDSQGCPSLAEWQGAARWGCNRERQMELARD